MNDEITVVGLGASAGGLQALTEFFDYVSPDIPVAFVVATHLHRNFKSQLDQILQRHTSLPVHRVEKDVKIEPATVYVLIENQTLQVADGYIHTQLRGTDPKNFAVDEFFESLAASNNQNAIAIVFSGGGMDGSIGANAISAGGGHVMVQDPDTALVTGMPFAVINGDHPKEIKSPKDLAISLNAMFSL
ncbi:MAG: chemotaxis protein CheB [Pedobacter sp.]|nr:MAG: chemotaxis protein CheB [Pedobacter sp.]